MFSLSISSLKRDNGSIQAVSEHYLYTEELDALIECLCVFRTETTVQKVRNRNNMKTAEEWHEQSDSRLPQRAIDIDDIKQIQLDAMKEGMRRAAELTKPPMRRECEYGQYQQYDQISQQCAEAILTAAEQLTEKDLQ